MSMTLFSTTYRFPGLKKSASKRGEKIADEILTHTAVRVPKMRTHAESITREGWLNGAVKHVIPERVTFTRCCVR